MTTAFNMTSFSLLCCCFFLSLPPGSSLSLPRNFRMRFTPNVRSSNSFSSHFWSMGQASDSSKENHVSNGREEAAKLRKRAQELLQEARKMELELQEQRSKQSKQKSVETNSMMNRLFMNRPLTPEAVARVMREERYSVDQVLVLLEQLYKQQARAAARISVDSPTEFQIANPLNAAVTNETEVILLENYIQCIFEAAEILDREVETKAYANRTNINSRWSGRGVPALRARYREWQRADQKAFERRLAMSINAAVKSNVTIQDYMRQTLGLTPMDDPQQFNVTRVTERVAMVPLWVPSSVLPYLAASRALVDPADVKTIKDRVLAGSGFYCTSTDSIPSAAVFRGNIRSKGNSIPDETRTINAEVFAEIQRRMNTEKLSDTVQLFLMEDPEWRPNRDPREITPKPVVLALPVAVVPEDAMITKSTSSTWAKPLSVVLSAFTTFAYGIGCYALNPQFFQSVVNRQDLTVLVACFPIALGVVAIQGVHELAHWLVARKHGIKIGWPLPLPSTQLGTFGCITPLRSFPKDRSAMLDFSLSGPVSGLLLSVILMVVGTFQTLQASPTAISQFPVVPVALLKSSFLTGTILSFLAPKTMMQPLSQPIPIHPLFMIGFSGLLASALNLLPIFRLDGGRACSAAMGQRFGAIASAATLLFMLSLALSNGSGLAWAWGLMIVFFQRKPEIPVRDDVTEVDDVRVGAWLASLSSAILALAPFPGGKGML